MTTEHLPTEPGAYVGNHNPVECGPENHKHAAQFVFGEPRATPKFTVEQLRAMGYVGLYTPAERRTDA